MAPLQSLTEMVADARRRTLSLVADLTDEQLIGPRIEIVSPLLWEIGHVAWFQEKWVLRHAGGQPPIRADGDGLYDSIAIAHERRWSLPLPSRAATLAYMQEVLDRVMDRLESGNASADELYFARYTRFHEDMHDEAFTYGRQTLGYPAPSFDAQEPVAATREPAPTGDREIPARTFQLGARRDAAFVFDNEKWAHPVELEAFAIARTPVTQAEWTAFVEDGGYHRRELWCEEGWRWREETPAEQPVYWRRATDAGWQRREFDRWIDLEPDLPMLHVNWYEASAYCRWAGRRLPTEAEWEAAACAGHKDNDKPTYPWGEDEPVAARVHMDWLSPCCVPVGERADGDSPLGLRQMIGNVWEWTDTTFGPYPGFVADAYREYSEPWFGDRKMMRGGCFATPSRMIRNTWRNYREPHRRDTFSGLRTCAL